MAVDEKECVRMMAACKESKTKLMIAHRLHFEQANLEAVKIAPSGQLGDRRRSSVTLARPSGRSSRNRP